MVGTSRGMNTDGIVDLSGLGLQADLRCSVNGGGEPLGLVPLARGHKRHLRCPTRHAVRVRRDLPSHTSGKSVDRFATGAPRAKRLLRQSGWLEYLLR
jgi:hypothetical protein